MGLQRTYRPDEGMPASDPGNRLREELTKCEIDFELGRRFAELIYTAEERGLIDFHIDCTDQATILRLVELARTRNEATIQSCRM
ncbi:hypothetical protein NKH72_22150 [Mesorhizobium sp. M0955]|uniref:hypothetical protein n=1 Tax=Mesorhizobium sp. M0955 TaxID=2957033 RepID=UPI00333538B1